MTVLRGLPLDLNLRFGKYRVDYGKLNHDASPRLAVRLAAAVAGTVFSVRKD